jgi:hypothetical protein
MTDQQFRESVRADSIRAGNPPAVADWLAKRVGEKPTEAERKIFGGDARVLRSVMQKRSQPHVHGTTAAAPRARTVDERRRVICDVYGASAVLPAFVASGLPLPRVAAILANVIGGGRATTAALAAVRNQLQAQRHWAGRAAS